MKAIRCVIYVIASLLLGSTSQANLFDDFDSYANTTAFTNVWTVTTGSGLALNTSEFLSSPNSVINPGTAAANVRQHMANVPATLLDFSFSFYDYDAGYDRDYGMLYSRSGDEWTGGLNNILAIGKYNAVLTNAYFGRMAFGTATAVYGDGAVTNGSWFALAGGPTRSIGWHTARITGEPDPVYTGMVMYKFYIDGVLGGSVANAASIEYNWTVLGSGLSITANPIAFDNVSVIPEPSTLVLGLLGLLGAACVYRLHRR